MVARPRKPTTAIHRKNKFTGIGSGTSRPAVDRGNWEQGHHVTRSNNPAAAAATSGENFADKNAWSPTLANPFQAKIEGFL